MNTVFPTIIRKDTDTGITLLVKNTGRRALFGRCDADLLASAAIQAAQGKKDLLRQALSEVIVNG